MPIRRLPVVSIDTAAYQYGTPRVYYLIYGNGTNLASVGTTTTIVMMGAGFDAGTQVFLDRTAITPVTVVSSNQATFTAPARSAGTYPLLVTNVAGGTGRFLPGIGYGAGAAPTYSLKVSPIPAAEGATVTFTLTTANVANGSLIPYAIVGSGIVPADLGVSLLSGTFLIYNNQSVITFTAQADRLTEGPELLTMTLTGISPTVSATVVITDTSIG
jgi:hypothetical protein